MLLFITLVTLAIIAAIVTIIITATVGGAVLVVFGDVVVFVLIMYAITKLIFKRRR